MTKNERRQTKYPDSLYFHYHNENPKNNVCGDCVVRAIARGMNKSYDEVYKDLYDLGFKKKRMPNDKNIYSQYLKNQGWIKCNQPKFEDNTKYTCIDFCKLIAKSNKRYIMNVGAHHIVAIVSCKVNDIWNSSNEKVGVYWYKP